MWSDSATVIPLSGRSELLVYIATTRYDGPAGTDRHMADRLSRHLPVLYVEPMVPVVGPSRSRTPRRLRAVSERLVVLTPRSLPGSARPVIRGTVTPALRLSIRAAIRRLTPQEDHRTPVRAVISCRLEDAWSAVRAQRKVFFGTDDFVAGAQLLGLSEAVMRRQEAAILRSADAVGVVSVPMQERLRQQGFAAELIPNGCDPAAYDGVDEAPPPDDVTLPVPVAGLIGTLNDRIDLSLLEAVADAGVSLLLVGPRAPGYGSKRFEALVARPGVCWTGPKPYAELPRYMRAIQVGLTPYANSAFNRASFPLKTLEYLAAGRPVVSTPIPANDWLASDLIVTAASAAQFAQRVRCVLEAPMSVDAAVRRRAFASEHSWERRSASLLNLVRPTTPAQATPASKA